MAGPNDQISQMEGQIAKFEQISQRFADYVQQGGQKFADSAKVMAGVYEKIAAEQANSVELMKEMAELSDEIRDKAKELDKLRKSENEDDKKKAAALTKELTTLRMENEEKKKGLELSQKEIKAVQDQLKEMMKVKTSVTELGKEISKTTKGWAEHLSSADALKNAFKGIAKASQDFADIQIQSGSYKGMTGDIANDLKVAGPEIIKTSAYMTEAQVKMAAFGYSAEEAGETFKKFSTLTMDPGRMEQMSSATAGLSKMLGVSLADSVQFVTDQQLKYNQTAEQSAAVLNNVYEQTKNYNAAAGMQVMRGRDVVKVMFDISAEGKMIAQDQVALEKMISSNLIKLQAQGQNYQEALAGAGMYVKKLTTEAPEWTKIMAGKDLLNQMDQMKDLTVKGVDATTDAMSDQLDAASPGLAKRVQDLRKQISEGTIDRYSGERMMQDMLQGTQVGMKAMQEQFSKVAAHGVQAVKAVYGVSEMEAQRMIDQNKAAMKVTKDLEAMQDPTKAQALFAEYKLSAEEIDALKSKSLTTAEKEAILQEHQDKMNLENIKKVEEANKKAKEDQLKAAKELYERRKKEGAGATELGTIQHRIAGLEGSSLQTVTDSLTKAATATQQLLGGNFMKQLEAGLKSPLAQMAIGAASVAKGVSDWLQNKAEIALLAEIAAATTETAAAATENAIATTAVAAETGVVATESGVTAAAAAPLAIPIIAIAAGTALMVGLLTHLLGNTEKEEQKKREDQSKNTQAMLDKRIADIQAGHVAPGVDKEKAIANIQRLKQEDLATTDRLNKQYTSTTMQKVKGFFHMGDLYQPQGGVANTPVSAPPQPAAPAGAAGGGGAGGEAGSGGGAGASSELIRTSTGTKARVYVDIDLPKAHAENTAMMQQYSTQAPR